MFVANKKIKKNNRKGGMNTKEWQRGGVLIRSECHEITLTPLHAVTVPSCASNTDVMHENRTIS